MTATLEPIVVDGWRAEPADIGGYWIYAPGYGGLCGHARTQEVAEKWLDESSGRAYKRLPEVKKSELRLVKGARLPIAQFPFRRNDWHQPYAYYLGDRYLGTIHVKQKRGRMEIMGDLKTICKDNGLRLVD